MMYRVNPDAAQEARAWTDTSSKSLPKVVSSPAPLAPEASLTCASRSAHASGAVESNPATGGTTVLHERPLRQGANITPRLQRALEIRAAALEREQAASADEFEALYERGNTILSQMQDRQQRLRVFRDLLLNSVGPA
jgi:hypothetical protein